MTPPRKQAARRRSTARPTPEENALTVGRSLAEMVRRVAQETADDESGETRLEQLVRALFAQAASGKAPAAALLLERGWGKTPPALDLDLREQLLQRAKELEIDWHTDPVLASIFDAAGIVDARGAETRAPAKSKTKTD